MSSYTIFIVPHTHYDVAWAFTKEDYLKINERILEEVLRIMDKNDDFKFIIEQTYLLSALEEVNPSLFARIGERIREGRIVVVDGQYLMPDTMLPTGEVLIRNIMVGKRYLKEKFGVDVPVAWAADSFGMNSQLPQIYKKSGYRWLAFRRGARADISESEFIWRGIDSSEIISHWMPLGYRAGLDPEKWDESVRELKKYASTPNILMPAGSGSMPPQEELPEKVEEWNKKNKNMRMVISTPEDFFISLERSGKRLKVLEGELYDDELVDVFPQVCSSRIWIVQGVRRCENLMYLAELYSTIAYLLGLPYPEEELKDSWEKILFLSFHDIITGCGVDEIYEEVKDIFQDLERDLGRIIKRALSHIARKIGTDGEAVVVFNPLAQPQKNWVEAKLQFLPGFKEEPSVEDSQTLYMERDARGDVREAKIGFFAQTPPLGYKVYKIEWGKKRGNGIKFDGEKVITPFYEAWVDENGILTVKKGDKLIRGNEIIIEDEIGDLYYHKTRFQDLIKSESGGGFEYGSFKPKSIRFEKGNLMSKIIFENEYYCLTWPYRLKKRFPPIIYKYKVIDIEKEVIFYRDLERIDFITRIKNRYPCIRLRVKFDTGMERKEYVRETQFGVISEPTEFVRKREEAKPLGIPNFLSWFDYEDGEWGICFMNRGLPACEIKGESVYITLLRSVSGLSADGIAGPLVPTPDALELRDYTYEYSIEIHEKDWREAKIYKKAQEYHHLPVPVQANSKGELPKELSFIEINPDNLILSCLKKAEKGEDIILRFFETKGEKTKAEIKSFFHIRRAWITNLLEEEEKEIEVKDDKIEIDVNPFEIITVKMEIGEGVKGNI